MKVILSTRNPSKAEQIKAIFAGTPIKVLTLGEAGIKGEAVEDGLTLEENAEKKARFAHRHGTWSMADDTGIFISALHGEPGVRAARWAGEHATTDEITQHTLRQLAGKRDRSALFRTAVAVITPNREVKFFSGVVVGTLLEAPRVKPQPKMPHSPLFVPLGSNKVWAEMTPDEENAISHRGQAFRLVREHLITQLT